MALVYPYHYQNNLQFNSIIPARGLVYGERLEDNDLEPDHAVLKWNHQEPGDSYTSKFWLYQDGTLLNTLDEINENSFPLAGLRPASQTDIVVESVTEFEAYFLDKTLQINPIGNRIRISWPEDTDAFTVAYKLYWDNATGDCSTPLKTITNKSTTQFITQVLQDSTTYIFRLEFEDNVGNESTDGTEYSIATDTYPLQLESVELSWNPTTRVATITGNHPATQHSDTRGISVYDNFIPGLEPSLSNYVNLNKVYRRTLDYTATGAFLIDTQILFPGQWYFVLRAIDAKGNESGFQILSLNLQWVGGQLIELSPTPDTVYNLQIASIPCGLTLTWDYDGENDFDYFNVYYGYGYGYAVGATTPSQTITFEPLTGDGLDYWYYIRAAKLDDYVGLLEGPESNYAYGFVDCTAPTGDHTLTLSLVF